MRIDATTLNEGWLDFLRVLYYDGHKSRPRGMETREILGAQLVITDPACSILTVPERGLNYSFMAAEALWMTLGLNRVDLIEPYNRQLGLYAADPYTHHFQGAYGPRITEEIDYVVNTLRLDVGSRQALISIWRPRPRASADIPCTVSMQFLVRDGVLHMHTYMRSQDIWLGTPYDVFNFTLIQALIAHRLGVGIGTYMHTMGSLHLYERNMAAAAVVLNQWSNADDLPYLRRREMKSAPLADVMAAYVELTARAPQLQEEAYLHSYVEKWWTRTYLALEDHQPWLDLLSLCGLRFHPHFLPSEWEKAGVGVK